MRHRWSPARCRHGSPASLSKAKSADRWNGSNTQHSPTHRVQSATRSTTEGWHKAGARGDREGPLMTTTRTLVGAVGVLLVTDLVGGLLAVASDVNTWGEAWGGEALLAAPLPMIGVQVLLTWAAVRGRRRWAVGAVAAVAAAGLLAAACLV